MGLVEFQKPVQGCGGEGTEKVAEGQRLRLVMDGVDVLSQPLNQDWGHLPSFLMDKKKIVHSSISPLELVIDFPRQDE